MLSADPVGAVIWNFLQGAEKNVFSGVSDSPFAAPEIEAKVFSLLSSLEHLRLSEIAPFSAEEKILLKSLLIQYIMFLTMFPHLTFPEYFLDGSDDETLGFHLLRYMAEHRWPFPQMRGGREN